MSKSIISSILATIAILILVHFNIDLENIVIYLIFVIFFKQMMDGENK